MTLPVCAHCGASLVRKARVLIQYTMLPGKPLVGWCGGEGEQKPCATLDKLAEYVLERVRAPEWSAEAIVRDIQSRGPGKVIAGSKWRNTL
jgi:hypothetical protein